MLRRDFIISDFLKSLLIQKQDSHHINTITTLLHLSVQNNQLKIVLCYNDGK